MTFVSRDDAAILTFHGTKDPLVPFDQPIAWPTPWPESASTAGPSWSPSRARMARPGDEADHEQTYEFFDEYLRPKPR